MGWVNYTPGLHVARLTRVSMQHGHVPKCKRPVTGEGKTAICGICSQAFKTQRGLSQHERLINPVEHSEKRERTATDKTGQGPNKGYGKVWQKEILLEILIIRVLR